MPTGPVSGWSNEDKIKETIQRSKKFLGPAVGQQLDALISPENLAILAGTLVIWAGSHFFGVGEVVDVALLLVGAAMLGPAVVQVAENLIKFGKCINAHTEQDLEVAAKAFADAVVQGGLTAILALLLRRSAKGMQASRAPGVARPSWLQIAKPRGKIGLPAVGPDPQPNKWWSRIPAVGKNNLPAGQGNTSAFGEIYYSLQGSVTDQQLVLLHETVHRFFSPRLGILRTFRARLNMGAYSRSVLLKYLEEAMAETYAQLRVVGFKGLMKGIRFPVAEKYVSLSELAAEGEAIGTIVVGSQHFTVSVVGGPPDWAAQTPPAQVGVIQGEEIEITGGYTVTVAPGSSLSAIAQAQFGDYNLWPLIYDLNKGKIGKNPNLVRAGMKLLLIPLERYTSQELTEARKRAPSWKQHAH